MVYFNIEFTSYNSVQRHVHSLWNRKFLENWKIFSQYMAYLFILIAMSFAQHKCSYMCVCDTCSTNHRAEWSLLFSPADIPFIPPHVLKRRHCFFLLSFFGKGMWLYRSVSSFLCFSIDPRVQPSTKIAFAWLLKAYMKYTSTLLKTSFIL